MDSSLLAGIIGASATLVSGVGSLVVGNLIGRRGKKKGLGGLYTELRLDGTTWKRQRETIKENDTSLREVAFMDFRQYGSRITGEAKTDDGKIAWTLEGIVYKGRLCYVYVDTDANVTSIGTASYKLSPNGNSLVGKWTGWAPDGTPLEPQNIVLTKVK